MSDIGQALVTSLVAFSSEWEYPSPDVLYHPKLLVYLSPWGVSQVHLRAEGEDRSNVLTEEDNECLCRQVKKMLEMRAAATTESNHAVMRRLLGLN